MGGPGEGAFTDYGFSVRYEGEMPMVRDGGACADLFRMFRESPPRPLPPVEHTRFPDRKKAAAKDMARVRFTFPYDFYLVDRRLPNLSFVSGAC